ncbi:MAG: hypothetical protein V4544_01575 [Pseudomonadota bacterium]
MEEIISAAHTPELSRIVELERLVKMKTPYTIKASDEECKKLAERFDFVVLNALEFVYTATHLGGKSIDFKVIGAMKASLAQRCSVTLKEIPEEVDDMFSFRVVHPKQEKEFELELSEFEDFEFSSDGIIDLGEIGAQYLSLSVDPYPRFDSNDVPIMETKKNPFDVLAKLKK